MIAVYFAVPSAATRKAAGSRAALGRQRWEAELAGAWADNIFLFATVPVSEGAIEVRP